MPAKPPPQQIRTATVLIPVIAAAPVPNMGLIEIQRQAKAA